MEEKLSNSKSHNQNSDSKNQNINFTSDNWEKNIYTLDFSEIESITPIMEMCKYQECNFFNQMQCEAVHETLNIMNTLAKRGINILKLECQRNNLFCVLDNSITMDLWITVCKFCTEQLWDHEKERCFIKLTEKEFRLLLHHQIYIVDLLCHNNTLKSIFFNKES